MSTRMVRKQIYIYKRQDILLKRLSQARGLSEAEIIRQAIERELRGTPTPLLTDDQAAAMEMFEFVAKRGRESSPGKPYRWNREEIYAERESRWLRDKKQDQPKPDQPEPD